MNWLSLTEFFLVMMSPASFSDHFFVKINPSKKIKIAMQDRIFIVIFIHCVLRIFFLGLSYMIVGRHVCRGWFKLFSQKVWVGDSVWLTNYAFTVLAAVWPSSFQGFYIGFVVEQKSLWVLCSPPMSFRGGLRLIGSRHWRVLQILCVIHSRLRFSLALGYIIIRAP